MVALAAQELTNLLDETIDILHKHNLKVSNIKYICNREGYIPIADFIAQARNINYDASYGLIYIDPHLCIVGASWWLQRYNYDGKESWIFLKKPSRPTLVATNYFLCQKQGFDTNDPWEGVSS